MISFALCTLEAISDKLRCGVWSRGKSLTDAESVAAGPYIALSPHTHTPGAQGRGLFQASGARLLHLAVPGPGCGCQLEKCSKELYDRC